VTAADRDDLSREVALDVDGDGVIVACDPRASERLGARPGASLVTFAAPGTEEKVRAMLESAREAPLRNWELALLSPEGPVTLSFHGRAEGDRVLLVGSYVPNDYHLLTRDLTSAMSELSDLHRETLRQREELARQNAELRRLNRELEESNRGVVALHAEIDEKADSLRRAVDVKSRVVANVSHEFRTPLNSILGISRLLLDESDGPLNVEQRKQVGFILRAAESLSMLVNDLLDLSKMESGKVGFRPSVFMVKDFFGSLRGMLKPLATDPAVELVIEGGDDLPSLETDEGKVAQVIRNLVSNALKFTERGEVRVSAAALVDDTVVFAVKDTGIGIAPADQSRIFEEFEQVDSERQRKVKGTGLGLALSRRLAEMLGGTLTVRSELGKGATFFLTIPRVHPEASEMHQLEARSERIDPDRWPVLVVEDDRQTLFLYEKYLRGSGFQVIPARTVDDAREALKRVRPAAIVLDVVLDGENTWAFLGELKSNERTRDIPTLVVTVTDREDKARALGADEFYIKPLDQKWLLNKLRVLSKQRPIERILVIDDDEAARYLVSRLLVDAPYEVLEAPNGAEGLRIARERLPHVIFLDFVMPGMSAFDVLDELKRDPATRSIPVIIHTSKDLAHDERLRLAREAAAILNKQGLSREVAIARIREALHSAVKSAAGREEPPP
jgi:signal transduction histidine kinase/CheY-like chemotaxis protein